MLFSPMNIERWSQFAIICEWLNSIFAITNNNNMTLQEKIKSNPYLKVSNCTDIADLECAMDDLRELDKEYPNSIVLLKIWGRMLDKKKKFQN